ncbi:MAG: helix-turn-helix domain-containing protein [Phycisphaera sp.]|nr:helix-turn-helix domain-containing protein [Phycisphaera sp.]
MSDRLSQIHDLTGRRLGWDRVVIHVNSAKGAHQEVASRLIQLARQRRWQLISLAKFFGNMPEGLTPRGAIVDVLADDPVVQHLISRRVPVVRIGTFPNPHDPIVPAVMSDRPMAARRAADHFAQRGLRHVAFVGRDPWGGNKKIYNAFAERATELQCECHLLRIPQDRTDEHMPGETPYEARWKSQQELFIAWLKLLPMPAGLLAIDSRHADLYCYWANEAGFRVPEELAVMGIGNDEIYCECSPVPITAVPHDIDGITQTAVDMLGQLMKGQTPQQTTVMIPPLDIVTRQSTDMLAVSDPLVLDTMRFMWDHVTENLSVDQIAQHVGVSRRRLEIAFFRSLRRGIAKEYQRRRLEKITELLKQTDLPIAELAQTMNFSTPGQLCRVFRAALGVSPGQYRRQHTPKA